MVADVDPRVRDALRPLLEYFGYQHELDGHRGSVSSLPTSSVQRIVPSVSGGLTEPIKIIDLHGLRVHEAKSAMSWGPALTAVYFGKGEGVMRDLFFEQVNHDTSVSVVGESGDTWASDETAVALLISRGFHNRLVPLIEEFLRKEEAEEQRRQAEWRRQEAEERRRQAEWQERDSIRQQPATPTKRQPAAPKKKEEVPWAWVFIGAIVLSVVFPPMAWLFLGGAAVWWWLENKDK